MICKNLTNDEKRRKIHVGVEVYVDLRLKAEVIGFNDSGSNVDVELLFEDGDAVVSGRLNTLVPIEYMEVIE